MGVNPMDLTKFGGDPTNYVGHATWKALLKLMVIAPLAEEIMFRLGLSFKRRTVALWLGLLPIVCAYYMHKCLVGTGRRGCAYLLANMPFHYR